MQELNYETFIHCVALDIKKYLPKQYSAYEVVVKCERDLDKRRAKLTLERENTSFLRQVELAPYYEKYKKGVQWDLLLREIRESLLNPIVKVKKQKKPLIILLLSVGGSVTFVTGLLVWFKIKEKIYESVSC